MQCRPLWDALDRRLRAVFEYSMKVTRSLRKRPEHAPSDAGALHKGLIDLDALQHRPVHVVVVLRSATTSAGVWPLWRAEFASVQNGKRPIPPWAGVLRAVSEPRQGRVMVPEGTNRGSAPSAAWGFGG